jgi:ribonuclease HII
MKEIHLREYLEQGRLEAGCDEAGRGPLAGPVFAAAVILPEDFFRTGDVEAKARLNDSKQMTEKARDELRAIIEKEADWAVEAVSPKEIDELNILWASVTGMQRAVRKLKRWPDFLLIDGNKFKPFDGIPYKTVVHGDATFACIAAASVLAKTHRDAFMRKLAEDYPEYGWDRNFGYPTKEHIEAIKAHGLTPWHRRSFHPKELEPTLFGGGLSEG